MRTRPRGLAMVLCLLVLAIVLIFAQAMGTLGIAHLNLVQGDYHDRVSAYAAEAGAARALHEIGVSSTWSAGWVDEPLSPFTRSAYTVQVTSNVLGAAGLASPDGVSVPPGHIYVLSTGTCMGGKHPRQTAVMLAPGSWFPYVLASGGDLTLGGSANIVGSVRSGGDMNFGGSVSVTPDPSGGRVLSGANLSIGSLLELAASQDVRARGTIAEVSDIRGTSAIYPGDLTADTDPFTMQEPFPTPDREKLLSGAVVHAGVTAITRRQTLDLGGKVHYFPDGISFQLGSGLTGSGTIVVGNGRTARFGIPLNHDLNVVALDSGAGEVGDARIQFDSSTQIRGIVYCEGNIVASAAFDVLGAVLAFGEGSIQQLGARAALRLVGGAPTVPLPGFEDFFGTGVRGGFSLDSWQRL